MKRVNSIDVMRTNKMGDFEDHFAIFSILFLPSLFLSIYSRLSQPLFLLMHTTQFSKVVLSNMMIISRGLRSALWLRLHGRGFQSKRFHDLETA